VTKIDSIVNDIATTTHTLLSGYTLSPIGGGSINSAYKLQTDEHAFFIKLNQPHLEPMFAAEAQGLQEMRTLNCLRIPEVICCGQADGHSYLVLEYIELNNLRGKAGQLLGKQLAQLHQHKQAYFGWHINNTIGSTPQYNTCEQSWLTFWKQHRLGAQLQMAAKNGFAGRLQNKGQQLLDNLHVFFADYHPSPALLHGDLWSGNAGSDAQGKPVLFDPACYYGDRETDLAMTELFAGFDPNFYASYLAEYPLEAGYQTRKILYNLYHIINHVNLFGGSYLSQAESMIDQLLAEIK
jgi:fructosamine-3-kinase